MGWFEKQDNMENFILSYEIQVVCWTSWHSGRSDTRITNSKEGKDRKSVAATLVISLTISLYWNCAVEFIYQFSTVGSFDCFTFAWILSVFYHAILKWKRWHWQGLKKLRLSVWSCCHFVTFVTRSSWKYAHGPLFPQLSINSQMYFIDPF